MKTSFTVSFILGFSLLAAACSGGGGGSEPSCPALNGTEVAHSADITADETWAGDGTVHRITFGFSVAAGATLTLAPCAVVKSNSGLLMTVGGSLVSKGTAKRPVLITNAVAGEKWGAWRTLFPEAKISLSYTTLENGGQGQGHGSPLNLRANAPTESASIPVLKVDHVVVKDSTGTGIFLESGAAFTADSSELTVTGGGGTVTDGDYAIEISQIAAGSLPTLHVSGNVHDAIRVSGGTLYISVNVTYKDRGVPYYFYFDRVRITDITAAVTPTLTVEPGVELRFDDYLEVGYLNPGSSDAPGILHAVGTAAKPILFTSSKTTRVAGDWPGVWLFNAAGSRLENVRIEYAGGFNGISTPTCGPIGSGNDAALFIGSATSNPYIPTASNFVGVEIANSASHGIDSQWVSTSFGPDLTAGITFSALVGCKQTKNNKPTGCGGAEGCLVP